MSPYIRLSPPRSLLFPELLRHVHHTSGVVCTVGTYHFLLAILIQHARFAAHSTNRLSIMTA